MMRVEISDQSGQQFLDRVTRTQLERALMRAAPPTNVATEASKEQTRKAMDLRALMQERVQMQRLGFGDAVHKLDEEIERRRALQAREKAAFEEKLLANRLRALEMMHHRRDQAERLQRLSCGPVRHWWLDEQLMLGRVSLRPVLIIWRNDLHTMRPRLLLQHTREGGL